MPQDEYAYTNGVGFLAMSLLIAAMILSIWIFSGDEAHKFSLNGANDQEMAGGHYTAVE
jgi:hypothetical protein